MNDSLAIERCALAAWPAVEVGEMEGWLLRFSHGVTRRANSVWPNGAPAGGWTAPAVVAAVARAETFYRRRDLPPRWQMSPAAQPADLDDLLAARGYVIEAPTAVQTAPVAAVAARLAGPSACAVSFVEQVTPGWVTRHAQMVALAADKAARRGEIMARISAPAAYWTALYAGEPAGVALTVAGDGWVGLFNMAVVPALRRRGIGLALLQAAAGWAAAQGAAGLYLQVMDENAPAQALYARAGFATAYHYFYRSLLPSAREQNHGDAA